MKNLEKKLYLSLLSGLFCVFTCGTAVGQIELQFSDGVTTGTTFNVDVGTTQSISVTAVETIPGSALSTGGLTGYGFAVSGNATSGAAATLNSFTGNPTFSFLPSTTVTASSADVQRSTFTPVVETSVFLGDFEVSVTDAGSTDFTFSDRSGQSEFASGGADLDAIVFQESGSLSFTINAISSIPEPSSGLLIGFSMLATMVRRRRNRS